MVTKYDTGDEVLIPVIVTMALKIDNTIYYEAQDLIDEDGKPRIIPEGLIE